MQQGMYVPKGMFVMTREILSWIVNEIGDCSLNIWAVCTCSLLYSCKLFNQRSFMLRYCLEERLWYCSCAVTSFPSSRCTVRYAALQGLVSVIFFGAGGRGYHQKNWMRVCSELFETFALFQTKTAQKPCRFVPPPPCYSFVAWDFYNVLCLHHTRITCNWTSK